MLLLDAVWADSDAIGLKIFFDANFLSHPPRLFAKGVYPRPCAYDAMAQLFLMRTQIFPWDPAIRQRLLALCC